ncbi:hypothetical protein ACFLYO_02355 [Chloroflexota bacterium]
MDVTVRKTSSLKKSILAMLVAIFLCFFLLFFTVDRVCNNSIKQWLPYYPAAKVISENHNFFRPQGMGLTVITLGSEDDPEVVRQFYRDNTLAMMRGGVSRGLAALDSRVEPDPDNVGGSLIYLYSECGQN